MVLLRPQILSLAPGWLEYSRWPPTPPSLSLLIYLAKIQSRHTFLSRVKRCLWNKYKTFTLWGAKGHQREVAWVKPCQYVCLSVSHTDVTNHPQSHTPTTQLNSKSNKHKETIHNEYQSRTIKWSHTTYLSAIYNKEMLPITA